MPGLILVFDLDQTLIDTNALLQASDSRVNPIHLNRTIIERVLRPAVQLRESKKGVDAIFILSNNSSDSYIKMVMIEIGSILGVSNVFDSFMGRYDSYREGGNLENPDKRLKDVDNMLREMYPEVSRENIGNRTYFFDDLPSHKIRQEIPEGHYIVVGGFTADSPDTTDYSAITSLLSNAVGGRRRTRKHRIKRKTLKRKQIRRKN